MAVADLQNIFGGDDYDSVLFGEKSCTVYQRMDLSAGWKFAEEDSGDRSSKRRGEWNFPTGKSGTFQCGCVIWNVPDRSKRSDPEHLEHGIAGLRGDGAGIYHCDRTMHGSRGQFLRQNIILRN